MTTNLTTASNRVARGLPIVQTKKKGFSEPKAVSDSAHKPSNVPEEEYQPFSGDVFFSFVKHREYEF